MSMIHSFHRCSREGVAFFGIHNTLNITLRISTLSGSTSAVSVKYLFLNVTSPSLFRLSDYANVMAKVFYLLLQILNVRIA